jgi:tripartite-type tricarboxylate transporter receptor subunit TctC
MKLECRKLLHLAASIAVFCAESGIAHAQIFPSRPITIVVGYAAGGPTDAGARILAESMKATLEQIPIDFTHSLRA